MNFISHFDIINTHAFYDCAPRPECSDINGKLQYNKKQNDTNI